MRALKSLPRNLRLLSLLLILTIYSLLFLLSRTSSRSKLSSLLQLFGRKLPSEASRKHYWLRCLNQQRQRIINTLKPIIDPSRSVALLDIPAHWNLGDSFIWLGTLQFFDLLGIPVSYQCDFSSCDLQRIASLESDDGKNATLVLSGGGNFGDFYRENSDFRNAILKHFPHNPIVIFPQSVKYEFSEYLEMDKSIYNGHRGNLTLVGRDQESFEFLDEHFSHGPNRSIKLSPDMALMLSPQLQNCQTEPKWDILFLLRRDNETTLDWSVLSHALVDLRSQGISYAIEDWFNWSEYFDPKARARLRREDLISLETLPDLRLQAAKNMLCTGRVVVSNRLHAMILSLLLHQPFVGLDNSYGKLSLLRKGFLKGNEDCAEANTGSYFVDTVGEAVDQARVLLQSHLPETDESI